MSCYTAPTLERDVANIFFPSVINQIRLHGDLLVRFEKDVSPELPNHLDTCPRARGEIGKPRIVVSDTPEHSLGQRHLTIRLWNPVDTNSLAVSLPRKLAKIVNNIAIIDI